MPSQKTTTALATITLFLVGFSIAHGELTDPDGKTADMTKPVQVYLLLGQSNMLGFGKINKRNEIFIGKYTNECSRCIRNQAR